MKIKQTNDLGEEVEVEVFTETELQDKVKETETNIKSEYETKLQALDKEKQDLESKIGEIKPDHPNFKVLKDALDKKDKDISGLREEITTDKNQRKQEAMDSKIKIASKGNVDLEKKIKLHLTSTLIGMKEDTEEERNNKMQAAIKLSSDHSSDGPGMFDVGAGGGGAGEEFNSGGSSGVEFTSREKALGEKLGISQEDYKKYANRVSKKI